ncbi:IS4 family transposase [Kitasatospora sp. NPDC049258]|uniref:IS4 family transposase n=1 Tax=Kitasatospora sp. NPDC049258 TaxID=3155394 RepID=UPI0034275DB7
MARTGQFSPAAGERLADLLGVCALTWALPSALVDGAVEAAGRTEQRCRALPARTVLYFTLAMWLHPSYGYGEVMRLLSAGLARKHRWAPPLPVPSTAAIAKARQRLGPDPLRLLFEQVAGPTAGPGAVGAFHRQWRLMSLDAAVLDVQESPGNRAAYGGPGAGPGPAPGSGRRDGSGGRALPQVKVLALAESATHAVCAAALGARGPGGADLVREVLTALQPGQLVVADHGALSYDLWTRARGRGAELLWRARPGLDLPVLRVLDDGSYLSRLAGPAAGDGSVVVRVVECPLPAAADRSGRAPGGQIGRLLCSILEPAGAGAAELARLYGERWRLDTLIDELGARPGRARPVLRSKSPAMVEQEVWAMFLAHHAIRPLLAGGTGPAGASADPVGARARAAGTPAGPTRERAR